MVDKPNSNAEDIKKENHTSSHAQEPSRLKTAKDTTATGTISPANSARRDNSQMNKLVILPVQHHHPGRNVTFLQRNAKTAPKEAKIAIQMLTVKLLVTQPSPNAMILLQNVLNVID